MNIDSIVLEKGKGNLYIQLYSQIKELIISKEFADGEKLPPIRELADRVNVNNVTVINAYKKLEKDGFIEKRVGSGSYVKYSDTVYNSNSLDFTGRDSNIDNFPLEEIKHSINYILENDGAEAFRYEGSQGFSKLQDSLKNYFSYFNIDIKKEIIQIVSGGQQALDIISKALLGYGDTVLTEEPSYKGAIDSFKSREARVIQIPLKDDGLDIGFLESKISSRKPAFLYLMPFNQKPTGINYSLNKKREILELAERHNFYIVEDDLGSEIAINQNENRTMKSFDHYDRVIYIKSFTPLFMPGLRLGCIIPPEKLYHKFLNIKRTTDISTPGLLQRGFSHYLNKMSWESYFLNLSKSLTKKTELTKSILKSDFSNLVEYKENLTSPCFWIKLQKGRAIRLKDICKALGTDIIPGETIGEDYSNYFRINLKSIPYDNIEKGLQLVKEAILKLYSLREDETILL